VLHALFRGDDSEDAFVGGMLFAKLIVAWTPQGK
jgi:hypothetical protein